MKKLITLLLGSTLLLPIHASGEVKLPHYAYAIETLLEENFNDLSKVRIIKFEETATEHYRFSFDAILDKKSVLIGITFHCKMMSLSSGGRVLIHNCENKRYELPNIIGSLQGRDEDVNPITGKIKLN